MVACTTALNYVGGSKPFTELLFKVLRCALAEQLLMFSVELKRKMRRPRETERMAKVRSLESFPACMELKLKKGT